MNRGSSKSLIGFFLFLSLSLPPFQFLLSLTFRVKIFFMF